MTLMTNSLHSLPQPIHDLLANIRRPNLHFDSLSFTFYLLEWNFTICFFDGKGKVNRIGMSAIIIWLFLNRHFFSADWC